MKKSLEGISQIIRVTRTPLSIVAIIIIAIAGLFALVLFAPIPNIAKYVALGLLLASLMGVWFQFWNKAKHEPLSATEEYHIQELRLRHLGVTDATRSPEEIELEPKRDVRNIERLSDESDPET